MYTRLLSQLATTIHTTQLWAPLTLSHTCSRTWRSSRTHTYICTLVHNPKSTFIRASRSVGVRIVYTHTNTDTHTPSQANTHTQRNGPSTFTFSRIRTYTVGFRVGCVCVCVCVRAVVVLLFYRVRLERLHFSLSSVRYIVVVVVFRTMCVEFASSVSQLATTSWLVKFNVKLKVNKETNGIHTRYRRGESERKSEEREAFRTEAFAETPKKRNIKRRRVVNKLNQREKQSTLISTRWITRRNIRIVFFWRGRNFFWQFFCLLSREKKRIQLNTKHCAVVSLQPIFWMRIPAEFTSICRISFLRSRTLVNIIALFFPEWVCVLHFTVNRTEFQSIQ